MSAFSPYLNQLRATPLDQHTELTGRAALEGLLNRFASEARHTINVQHEPKREVQRGAPDFKITKPGQILGYVEVKKIGDNLDKVLKSDQIAKYRKLSGNIIITDYLDFVWLGDSGVRDRARIAHEHELESRKLSVAVEKEQAVSKLLNGFFTEVPEGIGKAQQLALALAARAQLLRDYLAEELVRQGRDARGKGRLFGLYEVFKAQVFHELAIKEFADAFAQMLAYGLFLAKLNAGSGREVTLSNARDFVPASFRLIRELVDFLTVLNEGEYRDVRWVVEEVLSIVNTLDLEGIHADLSFRKRKAISRKVRAGDEEEHRLFERDPFIYFYEDFLKAYDKETRKSRGVYYTPPPIVNFIVRAVDDILKDTFKIDDGLADHKRVTVLDFACGTGTFLLETFEKVFDNIGGADSGKAALIVREHLLKNLYGFEYLIAPYTIAHLKLSQYLRDKGHPLKEHDRLQVFLTNTLEQVELDPKQAVLHNILPSLTAEVKEAQGIKERNILVIVGNPPYSGKSKNNSPQVRATIENYRIVDGKPLGERNPKWLQDDYVKFIRFAQMKMDAVDEGIVGIITNHSWLDNPTFRGMRQSIVRTFDQIWILDLHGSSKPKEFVPEGFENENVFDIQKGVSITLLIKKNGIAKKIRHSDIWGRQLEKYSAAANASLDDIEWENVEFFSPYYMLKPLNRSRWIEYSSGWQIADSLSAVDQKKQIFEVSVLGFQTHRDHFAIAFSESEMKARVADMVDSRISDTEVSQKYSLVSNSDWNLAAARRRLQTNDSTLSQLQTCAYRPFDLRFCHFGYDLMDRPRTELLEHVSNRDNTVLAVSRQVGGAHWQHSLVANSPTNDCMVSDLSSEANYVFPLHLFVGNHPSENLSPAFRDFLDARYDHHYEPEEILGYLYAILHAPAYRKRYAEFLRIDFPRIPFPEARADFDALSALGWSLVQVHLLRVKPKLKLARFLGKGAEEVEGVRYSPEEQAIHINKTQRFAPVPPDVWGFHIGGYQVLDKYLKSRKGRKLSLDEIDHVGHVADALAFTIRQMAEIDVAYAKAFPGKV